MSQLTELLGGPLTGFLQGERVFAGNITPGISTATSNGYANYRNDGKFEIIDTRGNNFTRLVPVTRTIVVDYLGNEMPIEECSGGYHSIVRVETTYIESSNGIIVYGEDSGYSTTLNNFVRSTDVESKDAFDMTNVLVADNYDYVPFEGPDEFGNMPESYEYGDPDWPPGQPIAMDWTFCLDANTRAWQTNAWICVINIPEPEAPPFIISTANVVMIGSEYVVLSEWFTNGANTENSNVYIYTVVI